MYNKAGAIIIITLKAPEHPNRGKGASEIPVPDGGEQS